MIVFIRFSFPLQLHEKGTNIYPYTITEDLRSAFEASCVVSWEASAFVHGSREGFCLSLSYIRTVC